MPEITCANDREVKPLRELSDDGLDEPPCARHRRDIVRWAHLEHVAAHRGLQIESDSMKLLAKEHAEIAFVTQEPPTKPGHEVPRRVALVDVGGRQSHA